MLYKPKFCCSCGEEIERVSWSLTDSRRFCELCETQYKVYDLVPRFLVIFGLLTGILGIGFYWQRAEDAATVLPHQIAENNRSANKILAAQTNARQLLTNQNVQESAQEKRPVVLTQNKSRDVSVKPNLPLAAQPEKIERQINSAEEKTYFCGAQTKKGTPCSRRVKGSGRCWQHPGETAMLPPEKLIARD